MRPSLTTLALPLILAGVSPGKAMANDTMAVLKAGGLVIATTEEISMDKEDLYISPSEVRVDYVYQNRTDHDVESIVAFPMPDLMIDPGSNQGVPNFDSENFMDFAVTQDGVRIEPQLEQKVFAGTLDVTAELEKQGIPKIAANEAAFAKLNALPEDVAKDWVARGFLIRNTPAPGEPQAAENDPNWRVTTTYWWRTTFPAGKTVTVHHTYKPSVGGTVAMTYIADGKPGDSYNEYKQKYCIDDAFMKASARFEAEQKANEGTYYFEQWLSYVLTTGANWYGNIGDFHLTIDKGKGNENTIISFCGDDVKKTGPTTFEIRKKDFSPERDIDILMVGKQNVEQ